jgi:hypothetical protein
MKLLIASDLHGSAKYCRQLIQAYQKEGAQKLLLLGDILYHGPRNPLPEEYNPMQVVELLTPYRDQILCVRGNCEAEVDQMVLPFPCLSDYAVVEADGHSLYLSHGHRAVPPMQKGDVYLTGHTHVPLNIVEDEGYYHLNPGSVSLPKNGSGHGYIVYESNTFTFKTFDGKIYDERKV